MMHAYAPLQTVQGSLATNNRRAAILKITIHKVHCGALAVSDRRLKQPRWYPVLQIS